MNTSVMCRRAEIYIRRKGPKPWIQFARDVAVNLAEDANVGTWRPEIVHCQDAHTALVPVYISELRHRQPQHLSNARTILTIHNLLEQGRDPHSLFDSAGFSANRLRILNSGVLLIALRPG